MSTKPDKRATELHVGSEGSGKTCFIAALNWLANARTDSPFSMSASDTASQLLLNDYMKAFRAHEFPAPTHRVDDLRFDLRYRNHAYRITVRDYEGEVFKKVGEEMRTDDPVFSDLQGCDLLLVFLDSAKDVENAPADSPRLGAVDKILSRFDMSGHCKKVALILSKADIVGVDTKRKTDAAVFLKKHQPFLYTRIADEGHDAAVFFLAAIGHTGLQEGRDPDPFGFESLFDWIQEKFMGKHSRVSRAILRAFFLFVIVGAISVSAIFAFKNWRKDLANKKIDDPNTSSVDRAAVLPFADESHRQGVINGWAMRTEQALSNTDNEDYLHILQEEGRRYSESNDLGENVKRISNLLDKLKTKIEKVQKDKRHKKEEDFVRETFAEEKESSKEKVHLYAVNLAHGDFDGVCLEHVKDAVQRLNTFDEQVQYFKDEWSELLKGELNEELKGLVSALKKRLEDLFWKEKVEGVSADSLTKLEDLRKSYNNYLENKFFEGHLKTQLDSKIDNAQKEQEVRAKQKEEIKNLLQPNSIEKMTNLVARLKNYKGFSDVEGKEVSRLCDIVSKFTEEKEYTITNLCAGTLKSNYRTFVRIESGTRKTDIPLQIGTTYKYGKEIKFKWQAGQPIACTWFWKAQAGIYPVSIAEIQTSGGLTQIFEFLTTTEINASGNWQQPELTAKNATFSVSCKEIPSGTFALFEKYMNPGTYWYRKTAE